MKYNRTVKYKIKARLNANNYKREYTVKSSLLKEFERLTKMKLKFMKRSENRLSIILIRLSRLYLNDMGYMKNEQRSFFLSSNKL